MMIVALGWILDREGFLCQDILKDLLPVVN